MSTIVTRAGKGSPLTHNEVDANFENLNSDKAEVSSLGTAAAADTTDFVAQTGTTGAAVIPAGTDAQRPTPATGQLRFNTDAGSFEGYDGTAWGAIGGGNYLDTAGGTMTGDIDFGDNVKATFGTSEDMWIYHDGGSSYIFDRGTGNLRIITNSTVNIDGASGGEFMAQFVTNGAVSLYYDNSKKFETTSSGTTITGSLNVTDAATTRTNLDVDQAGTALALAIALG